MLNKAKFIWTPTQAADRSVGFRELLRDGPSRRQTGQNRWFLFRRSFSLDTLPTAAQLEITADSRYQLFINGQGVGRGPVRSNPYYMRTDSYSIAEHLQTGKNCIAVLVHVYGVDTAWYETARNYWQRIFGDGGLYVCSDLALTGGVLQSDAQWRCVQTLAWSADTPRAGWGQAFIEDYDARKLDPAWLEIEFDDSTWPQAEEMFLKASAEDLCKGWGDLMPFPMLQQSGINHLLETPLYPDKIVATFGLRENPDLVIDRRVYDEASTVLTDPCIQNAEQLVGGGQAQTLIKTEAGIASVVLLRFAENHSGHPFVELECQGGEVIELVVSETLPGEFDGGLKSPPRIARETFLDCAQLFRYTARPGRQRFEKFEWTAVRYAQLVVRNAPAGVRVLKIGSTYTRYPLREEGSFECSDDFLNKLWAMGVYTTIQCTHDGWEDCPGREKRQWVGDGVVHYQVGAAAFGPSSQAVDRLFLMHALESQREDGMIQMFAPGDHQTHNITIPDFGLHWIMTIAHFLRHTGDINSVRELFPGVQRLLAWFKRNVGPHDLLVDLPYWNFIEWANIDRYGEATILNAMYVGALQAAATIAEELDYPALALEYSGQQQKVAARLNSHHWNAERGAYIGSVDPLSGEQSVQVSQHANAAMILWDIAPTERWPQMLAVMTDAEKLKLSGVPPMFPQQGSIDESVDVIATNTYFAHFVYSAIAKAGRFDYVLKTLRENFGPMLASGTTTLWESFHPGASLCHAFSATAVYQLSTFSLGIVPTTSGFTEFEFSPQFADLNFARGIYPSPHGGIEVSWQREGESVICKISLPDNCKGRFIPPAGFSSDFDQPLLAGQTYTIQLSSTNR